MKLQEFINRYNWYAMIFYSNYFTDKGIQFLIVGFFFLMASGIAYIESPNYLNRAGAPYLLSAGLLTIGFGRIVVYLAKNGRRIMDRDVRLFNRLWVCLAAAAVVCFLLGLYIEAKYGGVEFAEWIGILISLLSLPLAGLAIIICKGLRNLS